MPNKDIFKEIVKKLDRQKKGLRDPRIMHPEREWLLGIAVMIFVFLGSAYWSAQTYLKNRNVTSEEIVSDENVTYRDAIVRDVLQRFNKRGETYATLTNTPSTQPTVIVPIASTTEEVVEVTVPDFAIPSSTSAVDDTELRVE